MGSASAERGRGIFWREGCYSCHGTTGHGDGVASRTLRDGQGRPIRPRDYSQGVFRSGVAPSDITRAFSTGLDGTPMPALPPSVSARARRDLTRFILSVGERSSRFWRALRQGPTWFEPALGGRRAWRD